MLFFLRCAWLALPARFWHLFLSLIIFNSWPEFMTNFDISSGCCFGETVNQSQREPILLTPDVWIWIFISFLVNSFKKSSKSSCSVGSPPVIWHQPPFPTLLITSLTKASTSHCVPFLNFRDSCSSQPVLIGQFTEHPAVLTKHWSLRLSLRRQKKSHQRRCALLDTRWWSS